MSTPTNPLDRFRSYAYHHIMLATESTEAIRELLKGGEAAFTDLRLGKPAGNATSPYYLVFDTRKNSFFSITDMTYSSSAFANSSRLSNAVISTIDMQIVDTTGVTLVNYLRWLQDSAIRISLHKMVFILKTIFVGHTHDGKTETVYQDAIPMLWKDLTLSPSSLGSQVSAKFVPITNGAIFFTEDYSRTYDVAGVYSETGLLKDAIKSYEQILNQKSRKWFQELQCQLMNNSQVTEVSPATGFGKLVQYMFTIPEDWGTFKINGVFEKMSESKFSKGNQRQNVTPSGVRVGFNVTPTTDIIDILEQMLKQSDEVQKLASNENREDGVVKAYKIYPTITSDENTVVIHYDILNFAIPKKEESSVSSVDKSSAFKIPESQNDKNVLNLDYLFTGKNVDILTMDLKINNVIMAVADNIVIGDKASQEASKDQKNKEDDETKTTKKKIILNIKEKDPILPPTKTLSQQKNVSWSTETDARKETVKNRQQFIHNMSMAYAASSTDIIVKIRGNPNLFQRFSDSTLMPHVKSIDNSTLNQVKYISSDKFTDIPLAESFETNDMKNYRNALDERIKELGVLEFEQSQKVSSLTPFFVKINIKGQNVDLLADHFDKSFTPYENFWYDGYYIVKKVVHHFSNGDFTQDLLVGAIPNDLFGQTTSDKDKTPIAK